MHARVGLRCDASPTMGVGHLVRCLALGDELSSRGVEVVVLGEVPGPPWVREELRRRGLPVHDPPADPGGLLGLARELRLDAVVLDGYHLHPATGAVLSAGGLTVLAVVDGPFGAGQQAHLYLDQNLGAADVAGRPEGSEVLAGLDFVLFRDEVLAQRPVTVPRADPRPPPDRPPDAPPDSPSDGVPRVLCVFGGTDAAGVAPDVVPLVLASGRPVHVFVVAGNPDTRARLCALPFGPGQVVEVLAPRPDLAALTVTCAVTVSAAGSSVWELLCLGAPAAVVQVADNQAAGYRTVAEEGVALPLGTAAELRTDAAARAAATAALDALLGDPALRREMAGRGAALVDGRGRARVADALLRRIAVQLEASSP